MKRGGARLEARASRRLLRRRAVFLQLARSHLQQRERRRAKHPQRGRRPAWANAPLGLRLVPPELLLPEAPRGQQEHVAGRLRRRVQQRAAERREVGEQQLQRGAGLQEAELQLTVARPGVGKALPGAAPLRAVEVVLREGKTPQVPPGHPQLKQRAVGPMRLLRRNSLRRPPPPPNSEALRQLRQVLVLEAQQLETRPAVVQMGRGLVSAAAAVWAAPRRVGAEQQRRGAVLGAVFLWRRVKVIGPYIIIYSTLCSARLCCVAYTLTLCTFWCFGTTVIM